MKKIKKILFGVSLFYLTLYLPFVLMSYCPQWYAFNCNLHPRCKLIGYSNALRYINELTGFFFHRNSLSNEWTSKEKLHLIEVRDIFDFLVLIAILCILLLILFFDRTTLSTYALLNLAIILSLLLLLPFFKTFWVNVFHPLLFNNDLWMNTYRDRSFYIMPDVFFKHSIILLISMSTLLNGFGWLFFRKFRSK